MQHPLRALATAASAVVLTGGVAATAYWAGTTSTPEGAAPATSSHATPPAPAAPPPEVPAAPTTPAATPETAALAWLTTTNTLSWHDPAPDAWVARAEPYLTGDALRTAAEARNGGAAGTDWDRMTSDRCTQRVIETGGVIPPEAPRSDTVVYVQVSGTVVQQCAAGAPLPPQPIAATLEVTRGDEGTWRVSSQLF